MRLLALQLSCLPLLSALATAGQPAPTSACFADATAYMMASFGAAYRDDENLRVSEKVFGKTSFTLVEDMSSGTNHARVLLRPDAARRLCVVLATPPVAQLDAVKVDAAGVPLEFRAVEQAPPGSKGRVIVYRLTGAMGYVISNAAKP